MLFLIALVLAFAFAFLCKKPLKQHPYLFYTAAALISVIVSAVTFRGLPEFVNTYIIGLFSRGALGTAFWAVVMWTGAFPNGSKPIKALMPIRGELSIFAAILTLGHNIGYGRTYFVRLFTDASRMSGEQITASVLTIALLLIMIPLTIMSFPQVRRKMNARLWKKLQRTAYLFYAMIYAHVMVLFVPMAKAGRDGYFLSVLLYSIVFLGYAVCRVRKWYMVRKKPETTKLLNAVSIPAFAVLLAFPCVYAGIGNTQSTVSAENASVQTTASSTAAETTAETERMTEATTAPASTATTAAATAESTETTEIDPTASAESTETETETTVPEETAAPEEPIVSEEIPTEAEPIPEPEPEPVPEPEPETEAPTEPPTEPEPVYIYNNGSFTASAYGYDGDVEVTVTIENDVIVAITGVTYESDPWYYDSAAPSVISQILASQNTQVDAYAGATYSSDAIMTAVANALNMARK